MEASHEWGTTFKENLAAEAEADADELDCILFSEQSCSCLFMLLQRHAEILQKWGVQLSAD